MVNNTISGNNLRNPSRLIVVMLGLSLLISACTGTSISSATSTPTTVMGVLPPVDPSTPVITQTPIPVSTPSSDDTPAILDVCSMISSADAALVLGQTPIASTPGIDTDNETGVTINFCTYLGQGLAVVFSTTEAASSQAAKELQQKELAQAQAGDVSLTITEETGVGDQVFWSVAEHAASYTVRTGTHVFSIALGGTIGDPLSHKGALLDLAKKIASAY